MVHLCGRGVSSPTARAVDKVVVMFLTVDATEWCPNRRDFAANVARSISMHMYIGIVHREEENYGLILVR